MVLAALKRRPNVRFCRHQSRSPQWARATDPIQRSARGHKTLWICRCAWTTLPRRPQLHRANISKHCLMKQKKELRLGRRTSEATRARVVRQRSTSRQRSPMGNTASYPNRRSHHNGGALTVPPSCEVCGTKMRPNGELASDPQQTDRHRQTRSYAKSPISQVIVAPRAQASRRCETQATLGGKPPSFASVSVP